MLDLANYQDRYCNWCSEGYVIHDKDVANQMRILGKSWIIHMASPMAFSKSGRLTRYDARSFSTYFCIF